MLIGLLTYIPAIVLDSFRFRSKRRVRLAPWFVRLPLSAKILLVVLAVAVALVMGLARATCDKLRGWHQMFCEADVNRFGGRVPSDLASPRPITQSPGTGIG